MRAAECSAFRLLPRLVLQWRRDSKLYLANEWRQIRPRQELPAKLFDDQLGLLQDDLPRECPRPLVSDRRSNSDALSPSRLSALVPLGGLELDADESAPR